ncbi:MULTISPECIES: DUF4402 domain-containing protein [unclassified Pseudoalteromonas]|uniref:DUF4402 domain-containing protein n=1 Tax=unclassified Pseudoalteromonas TaxID=194690 RepID=UPI000B3CA73F|nr:MULTISPECIES: DUF4402 domain-containing protein [unclassified Pseudoalteromonas]MDN3379308.1 DUF4402 domain-containing protein [Pseudoalteromonas sp. APC 3893]MDN3386482.1 DUF4402 domain-containing protein [Pseudoalteromonas sp. APC 4017]OUS69521.1 hypothetical protein B5G52_16635 [Pseudoalteromonas sp. A601]
MKLSFPLLAVSTLAVSFYAISATETFRAEVTVQNAVGLDGTDLNFGTVRAVADPGGKDIAELIVSATPNATPITESKNNTANALFAIIEDGAPATFTVSEAVPSAVLRILDPTKTNLEFENGQDTDRPDFTIGDWKYVITSGDNNNADYTPLTPNLQVGQDGTVSFNLGATLKTSSKVTTKPYADGVYAGTFQIEVAY